MGSLLQRAREIRKKLLSIGLIGENGEESEDFKGVPEEERILILNQINEVLDRNRIDIDDKKLMFTPQKSGALLPVLINIFALAVLAGGIFLFFFFFNQNEASITQETATAETAEGRLIKALKEESERQISEKENEIAAIQDQLENAKLEQERLKAETEAEISRRERELRSTLEAELEAERQRLREEGFSEEIIAEKLKEFEEQKRLEFDAQLAAYTSELEAQQAAKEQEMTAQIAAIQDSLIQAREEREKLEKDLAEQAAQLEKEYRARQAALEGERAEVLAQLDDISRLQEQEDLVVEQVLLMYDRTNEQLKTGEYNEALSTLDNLSSYLAQPNVSSLPAIQRRQSIESFIIESMRRLILNEQALAEQKQDTRAAEELLASVSTLVEEGNLLFNGGDMEGAQDYYLKAIAQIPVLEGGYGKLKDIESLSIEEEKAVLARLIEEGDRSYRREDWESTVQRYTEALTYLENETYDVDTMIEQIMDAGYKIGSAGEEQPGLSQEELDLLSRTRQLELERELLLRQLEDIEKQYELASSGDEGASSQETLVALLNTKLLIKQILASDSIRSEHPDLYKEMDQVFEAYGEEKRKEGRDAAIKDLVAVTQYLTEQPRGETPVPETLRALNGQQDLLLQFFANLKELLALEE